MPPRLGQMTTRTSRKTVTFRTPFLLAGLDEVQPAGTYVIETDEVLLDMVSFPAYQRVETFMHLLEDAPGVVRTMAIDPADLAAALARDAVSPE
jgi:hypothetical protein